MCASTYTSNLSSQLNIENATQPADLLSHGNHELWQGRADNTRRSTAHTRVCWFDAGEMQYFDKYLQLMCCKLNARLIDTHRTEVSSLWRAHLGRISEETECFCVCLLGPPRGLKLVAWGKTTQVEMVVIAQDRASMGSPFKTNIPPGMSLKQSEKVWYMHGIRMPLKQTLMEQRYAN